MNQIDMYMKKKYRMEVYEDYEEGGFTVSFPELRGCISCGKTLEEAYSNAIDAKRCWIKAALEEGVKIPEPRELSDYSGQFKLRIPKDLHRTLVEQAKEEGISMNQYCTYLLTKAAKM
jgi:antitoxin HicB